MTFAAILGQEAAVGTLVRAVERGRVHHAYRFEGPPGVGKEMAAFALAQALVCPERAKRGGGSGCGACSACKRAVTFSSESPEVPLHPDVIVVERGLYAAEALGRSRPETQDISVDQIRKLVLARAPFPPHEEQARVFIVRQADELSTSAANALLKTLEEPPPSTHFILITSRERELLDTIRSRTLPVRFAPLADAVLRRILEARSVPAATAEEVVELARGSASTALELADPESSEARNAFVKAALEAVASSSIVPSLVLAEGRERDKDVLGERLASLAAAFARMSRDDLDRDALSARRSARRYEVVGRAIGELERNVSPALLLETMMLRLRAIV
jgi:DNA polymerase-3 subunit delta'